MYSTATNFRVVFYLQISLALANFMVQCVSLPHLNSYVHSALIIIKLLIIFREAFHYYLQTVMTTIEDGYNRTLNRSLELVEWRLGTKSLLEYVCMLQYDMFYFIQYNF